MISVEEFGQLRLAQFTAERDIQQLTQQGLYARDWIGESAGCVDLLCPIERPESVGAALVRFAGEGEELSRRFLEFLGLELHPGMVEDEIRAKLGPPWRILRIGDAGRVLICKWGEDGAFDVLCLIWSDRGLSEIIISVALKAG